MQFIKQFYTRNKLVEATKTQTAGLGMLGACA